MNKWEITCGSFTLKSDYIKNGTVWLYKSASCVHAEPYMLILATKVNFYHGLPWRHNTAELGECAGFCSALYFISGPSVHSHLPSNYAPTEGRRITQV